MRFRLKGFALRAIPARIDTLPDDVTEPGVQGVQVDRKPYLLASRISPTRAARVTYCSTAPPDSSRICWTG